MFFTNLSWLLTVIRSTWESEWVESPLGVCVCVGGGNNSVEQGFSFFSNHPPVDLIFSPSLHVHKLSPYDPNALLQVEDQWHVVGALILNNT